MSSLQEAREAIGSGNQTAAQAIIAELLKSDQNNAEAWFLLSEATEGDRKLIFLNKALNLDPNLREAIQRKAELEGTAEPEPEPEPEKEEEEEEDSSFATIPPADFEVFGEPDEEEDPQQEGMAVAPPATTGAMSPPPSAAVSPPPAQQAPQKEDEEPAPSSMVNTIGFAFSLALSAVLLILFIRAVLDLF